MKAPIIEKAKEILMPLKQYSEIYLSKFSSKHRESLNRQKMFYGRFISRGDLVFDVGAHIGSKTEVFLELQAKVISVEPQERCIKMMKVRFNNSNRVIFVNKGLSDKEGALELFICDRANTISTFSEKWKQGVFKDFKWKRSKMVPVTTLDNLIKEYGIPVFCKIDVEGYELNVLKGLSSPIKHICFEFIKEFFDDAKLCMEHIASVGPAKFNCYVAGRGFLFKDWVEYKVVCATLEQIDDDLVHGDIFSKID